MQLGRPHVAVPGRRRVQVVPAVRPARDDMLHHFDDPTKQFQARSLDTT
jgi:hypothetical protein